MDRCLDKGNVPDKENVNVYTLYVRHIEGYRKLWFVMSLSCLYTHSYSPHKQYKYYKYMYDVLVMSCILCTCTRNVRVTWLYMIMHVTLLNSQTVDLQLLSLWTHQHRTEK